MKREHTMIDLLPLTADERLTGRICGEYLEMPGLQLTCTQAQRLFGLDAVQCARVLDDLVGRRFLVRRADGRYVRWTDSDDRVRPPHRPLPVRQLPMTA